MLSPTLSSPLALLPSGKNTYHSPLILGTTWQIFRPFFRLIHRTTIKGNILIPKMLQETWQEILKLQKEPRFTRNLTLLFLTNALRAKVRSRDVSRQKSEIITRNSLFEFSEFTQR